MISTQSPSLPPFMQIPADPSTDWIEDALNAAAAQVVADRQAEIDQDEADEPSQRERERGG